MKIPIAAALVSLVVLSAPAAWAQTGKADEGEIKTLLAKIKSPADKRVVVASTLSLTDAEARKFWPVYDAYQRKLEATNRQYSRAIEDVVMSGRPVSDAYARNLSKELAEIEDAESRARKTMYTAAVKALPGRKAIRYLQLESKLQAGYRYDVATTFPLIP